MLTNEGSRRTFVNFVSLRPTNRQCREHGGGGLSPPGLLLRSADVLRRRGAYSVQRRNST